MIFDMGPHPDPKSIVSSTEAAILLRIHQTPSGKIFKPQDFSDLAGRSSIARVMSRLVVKGVILRVRRGWYYRSQIHPRLGMLALTPESICQALTETNETLRFQVSGAFAANALGLTDQVPTRVVFLTNGASRTVMVGNQEIQFRRTSQKFMSTAGKISGTVIQALRYIGKEHVDPETLVRLGSKLTVKDKLILREDSSLAPLWISRIMLDLAKE